MRQRALVTSSIAIALACGAVALSLDGMGRRARAYGDSRPLTTPLVPVVARTARDVYATWKAAGVRGRVVVHAGEHLHLVSVDAGQDPTIASPRSGDLFASYERQIGPRNYLWVAGWTGIARRIHLVLPERVLRRRHRNEDLGSIADRLDIEGFPVVAGARPPEIDEPVLLDVEASWFEKSDGRELAAALRSARITSDVVTVNLSEDNLDVTDGARARALAFARALAEGRSP